MQQGLTFAGGHPAHPKPLSDKDLGKKKEAGPKPRRFPFTTQQQLTQTSNDLGQREGLVKSIILCDSDTLAAWTGEGSNLLAVHGS